MVHTKPSIYLTTPVFEAITKNLKVSPGLSLSIMNKISYLKNTTRVFISDKRFPDSHEISRIVRKHSIDFIGCHLSHTISDEVMQQPSLKAVSTSTAGYNHISECGNVLVTHTPSILDKAVADYTIALILNNLRNVTALHNQVWSENWSSDQKWDLDDKLSNTIDSKVLGIYGLGEIGREVVRRLASWGIRIIYYSRTRNPDFESKHPCLEYRDSLKALFSESDIISLHVPLTKKTTKVVDETLMKCMKKGSLLVNTSRGSIIDFEALTKLLKKGDININLAFDVFDPEPVSGQMLREFKEISQTRPDLRINFMPHNASSDADTRAQMAIMMLDDIICLAESVSWKDLNQAHLIPGQKNLNNSEIKKYKIYDWWEENKRS